MAPLPLRELQLRLRALIASPPDVPAAELERALDALAIRGDERLSAAERVRVYGTMYFLRLRDALAHDFVALERALGAEGFAQLVRCYVATHPSDRPSLRDLGRHLPAFTQRHPELLTASWQSELAQLEWAMVEAFDATDQPVLCAARLDSLAAESWPELRLEPVASLVLLECATPVDLLRERILAGEPASAEPRTRVRLRVWRQQSTVFHRRMDAVEIDALRWMGSGVTFAALCTWLGERIGDDAAAGEALRLLGRWLDDGLLVAT